MLEGESIDYGDLLLPGERLKASRRLGPLYSRVGIVSQEFFMNIIKNSHTLTRSFPRTLLPRLRPKRGCSMLLDALIDGAYFLVGQVAVLGLEGQGIGQALLPQRNGLTLVQIEQLDLAQQGT